MRPLSAIIATMLAIFPAAAAEQADSAQSVGLVLSGGGAKGIAHIGFIQALEDNDIPIDCITGTSMGAIVGSLYSIGYSPAEMMELLRSQEFADWSSGIVTAAETYNFLRPADSSQWIGINVALRDSSSVFNALPTRLIYPLPMSYAFMDLYAASATESDSDFDCLMVPFRCVASDVFTHKSVVFSHGQLADAVRASMSFPLVFQPIEVNGSVLYDGGLYDVYPVDVMMSDFHPDRLIGLNVSSANVKPGLNNLIGQLEDMITNERPYRFPDDRGINVRFHLDRFSLLDWGAADEIYGIGYRRGMELADSIKQRITARRSKEDVEQHRRDFKAGMKAPQFTKVVIDGTSAGKAEYIRYLLTGTTDTLASGSSLDMAQVRDGFYKVASTGRMRNFVPHAIYNDTTGCYTLRLDADVDRDFKFGVGGYLTSSAGSMIYAMGRFDPFKLLKPSVLVEGWAGPNYLGAKARMLLSLPTAKPSRLMLTAVASRESNFDREKMVYDFKTPSFLTYSEIYVKGGYQMATSRHSELAVNAGFGHTVNRYHVTWPDDPKFNGRNRMVSNVGLLETHWLLSTLNDADLPDAGTACRLQASLQVGRRTLHPWDELPSRHSEPRGDFTAELRHYFPLGRRFSLGASADVYYSTRPLLHNYNDAVANAEAFCPTSSTCYIFDPAMRANSYVTVGLHPVVKLSKMLQLRADGWAYAPMRPIVDLGDNVAGYGDFMSKAQFLGELTLALRLPFGSVKAYGGYSTSDTRHWWGGISLGLLIRAPRFTN